MCLQKADIGEDKEEIGDEVEVTEDKREDEGEGSDGEYTDSEGCEEEEEEDDDDIGWITPENLAEVKIAMGGARDIIEKPPTVACVTSDFAMQVISPFIICKSRDLKCKYVLI